MKLYNTLTRSIEELQPLNNKSVKLYTCGLTVYSQPHIGNWVGYIYWDVLQRALSSEGYTVQRVENYTDVGHLVSDDDDGEDKMEKGARREGKTAWEIADKYITIAKKEVEQLHLQLPTYVRATDCIDEQIEFVNQLEAKGYTYVIENEGVYFDTSKLSDYGKLARLDIAGLQQGARVEVNGKKNVSDFALWKFSPKDKTRDMQWESPWGIGFPGWHLECSVIARENLGDQIDIHTGGVDHIPVHHTNEIAQTESLTGKQFSQIWLHNNHLKVDGSKMSKSLGNIYSLQDIIDHGYSLMAFKLLILTKNYQTEGNFTWEIMQASQNRYTHWQAVVDLLHQLPMDDDITVLNNIKQALLNNLNTPEALRLIDDYFSDCEKQAHAPHQSVIEAIDLLLGITFDLSDIADESKALLHERAKAREQKNWIKSDQLRDRLSASGITVRDDASGQIWSRSAN